MIFVPAPQGATGWLRLMPAGPAPSQAYWAALKELGARLQLTDLSGRGFMALLDLQARIADELTPDYLLIDARTGVTELGGLATAVLADTVVCMFAPNNESLEGTLAVVAALKAAPRLGGQKPIRIVPVQSRWVRIPRQHKRFALGIARLSELTGETHFVSLPHDDIFGASEGLVGGEGTESGVSPLYKAHIELFLSLFPEIAPALGI
jgi:hypothetical protein